MIVADASALVEFLMGGQRGEAVAETFLAERDRIQVPSLADVEVVQALRRLVRLDVVSHARASVAVEILQAMPLERHAVTPLLPRIWHLREALTAYDAAYVALAEALGCPLLTFDRRLARGMEGVSRAEVVVPEG